VLVEGADPRRPGWARGTSCRYVPVAFRGHAPALIRQVVPVRAVAAEDGTLCGEPEAETNAFVIPSHRPSATRPAWRGRQSLPVLSDYGTFLVP
jgi:hypothetical protein